MAKLVKYAEDMVQKFSGKTAPDRVGTRYEAAKTIALNLYAANGLGARAVIESARGILSQLGVPAGAWGIHIAFVLKLWKIAKTYAGAVPESVVDGFKSEFTAIGADPAVLDALSKLVVG